jgi:hypothetical protein
MSKLKVSDKDDKASKLKVSDKDDKASKLKVSDKDDKASKLKVSDKDDKTIKTKCFDKILLDYVANDKNKFHEGKDDNESLSILIDIPLSQSEKIQFGNRMENMLLSFILHNTSLKNIKQKNQKGVKETDHLFMDMNKNIIHYAELKSNLNLDTEKSAETVKKCLKIKEILRTQYPEYKIKMSLVSLRHLSSSTIRNDVKNKYDDICNNLLGVNEYLLKLGISQQKEFLSEENYKIFINKFVKLLKQHN